MITSKMCVWYSVAYNETYYSVLEKNMFFGIFSLFNTQKQYFMRFVFVLFFIHWCFVHYQRANI